MKKYFAGVALCLACGLAQARTYYVARPDGTASGVDLESVQELIRNAVTAKGQSLSDSAGAADYVLKPHLLRLGSALILSMDRVKDSEIVNSARLKASTVEDLDIVSQRVTNAVLAKVPAKDSIGTSDVTQDEVNRGTRRRNLVKHWYLGLGPYGVANLGSSNMMYGVSGAYGWDYERATLKFQGDVMWGSSGRSLWSVGLGGNFFFSDQDVCPFITASFGVGTSTDNFGLSSTGFSLGAGFGVQFFRTSAVNLELTGEMITILSKNTFGFPRAYGGRVGFNF